MSSDGQVSVFPIDDLFGGQIDYDLQRVGQLPEVNPWLSVIGQAYRVSSGSNPTTTSAIMVSYLGRDVPSGQEENLRLYYSADAGQTWQRLETELDVYRNQASALIVGEGLYALMATLEMPQLAAGWNLLGYPVAGSQPISQALSSIDGHYTMVFRYDRVTDTWLLYDATIAEPFASLVNTLETVEFGYGYWIYATETVTPYINPVVDGRVTTVDGRTPPAVFYGWVTETESVKPEAGMVLEAYIDGQLCGSAPVFVLGDGLAYRLLVEGGVDECGRDGVAVEFVLDGQVMSVGGVWRNSKAQALGFSLVDSPIAVYLPTMYR